MHMLWAETLSCGTTDSTDGVKMSVTSKIQAHSIYTAVVDVNKGRLSMHMFKKGFPLTGIYFTFLVPTLSPRYSNNHILKNFCAMLINPF